MERLVNDMIDSAALYGVFAFFSFWAMIGMVSFDFAEWMVPYLAYSMASLPLFCLMDLIVCVWRIWRNDK